jgi:hypothetical protein
MNWLVPSNDYNPEDESLNVPEQAPIKMRKAVGGDPLKPREEVTSVTVAAEEREVNTVAARNEMAAKRNAVRGRQIVAAEDQEGTIIRSSLTTPAKQQTDLGKVSVSTAIRAAENTCFQAEEGNPRVVARVKSPEEVVSDGIKLRTSVGTGTRVAAKGETLTESEGIIVRTSVGSQPAEEGVIESEGIRFTTTNGPKKDQRLLVPEAADDSSADQACRTIAKSICPDFPNNYVFTAPARKKLARIAADYDDRPDIIRAVAAAETDPNVKSRLVADYPEAFSG